jgi:hypothetical protein
VKTDTDGMLQDFVSRRLFKMTGKISGHDFEPKYQASFNR